MAPVPIEACVAVRDITEPRLSMDRSSVGYVSSVPGRTDIVVQAIDATGAPIGLPRTVTDQPMPRAGRGHGGGCWCWSADAAAIVYAAVDGDLWWQPIDGATPTRLTRVGEGRAAQAPAVSSDGRFVAHVIDQTEVWSVSLADRVATRLDDGLADFCFDPAVAPGGDRVAWLEWDIPDMPWDAARIAVRTLADAHLVRHRPAHSVQQPRWMPDGSMLSVRDDRGWLNVWTEDAPLLDEPIEHAGPTWGLGQRSYVASPTGERVAFTRNEGGFGRLCVFDRADGSVTELGRGVHGQISWEGNLIAALRSGARTPPEVVVYDLSCRPPRRSTVAIAPTAGWDRAQLVEPELLEASASDGVVIPFRWYPAGSTESGRSAASRTICWIHGGPTDQWQVTFMPRIEYFRSRGWNIVVPDHRGSTGHGREFQQALEGRWGEADSDDVAAVLRSLHRAGTTEPGRTVLMGGSAGGFTALGVVARHPGLVRAVSVSYPVTDLVDLERRSHRFERHSVWRLVARPGETAAGDRRLRERSPVQLASLISVPIALAHGSDDPVVPVDQSRELADRIVAAGGRVDLVVYDGEGHGFRSPEHQRDDYRRTEAFLEFHVPAEPLQG
jgi:dipeptidyl aminopeptidase/acylaminoacyl peptidase